MPLSQDAQAVYNYLVHQVMPTRRVVTYSDVHRNTGVEYGEEGGYIGRVLGEIFNGCDHLGLPPITSVVVRQDELQERMPGPGYFRALAASENRAGRRQDRGVERWQYRTGMPNFDADINRWEYRDMIADHQASVWQQATWPRTL